MKSLCSVPHLQGEELARATRCLIPEDVSRKAEAPNSGADMSPGLPVSIPSQPHCSTDERVEALAPTCSMCGRDLQAEGSRLLPCQHLLCKDCYQGFMQELGHATRAYPGSKYKKPLGSPQSTSLATTCFIRTKLAGEERIRL